MSRREKSLLFFHDARRTINIIISSVALILRDESTTQRPRFHVIPPERTPGGSIISMLSKDAKWLREDSAETAGSAIDSLVNIPPPPQ